MNGASHRFVLAALALSACSSPQHEAAIAAQDPSSVRRLPTGVRLDPAGVSYDLGSMPLAMTLAAEKDRLVVLVLEDDAQDGPDHVDSHRSILLVISPYNRGGVFHRFVNTTDVLATIEDILGLGRMSQFDHYGRPLREIWEKSPDLRPYGALTPAVSLRELNPKSGTLAEASKRLALDVEDEADEDLFNRILWKAIKGDKPYPASRRMSALEAKISR